LVGLAAPNDSGGNGSSRVFGLVTELVLPVERLIVRRPTRTSVRTGPQRMQVVEVLCA
jgi:hypothetical protein